MLDGRLRFGVAVAVALLMLPVSPAAGQFESVGAEPRGNASRKAAARALFEEGLKLLEAEHWAAAVDRFERARKLHASPRITYNLSVGLIQQGRLVYASELLRELTGTAAVERSVQSAAEERLQTLRERIGTLTITVEGDLSRTTLELDSRPLETALLDVAIPVDPGDHRVVARREGQELVSRTIAVEEGQARRVQLALPARPIRTLPQPALATALRANSLDLKPQERADNGIATSTWMWLGVGVGVVATGIVTALLLSRDGADPIAGSGGTASLRGGP